MTPIVCQAIASRRLLAFVYDGHPRVAEPHCHGTGAEGQDFMRAYQIGGTSASGELGWKLFDMARMTGVHLLSNGFAIRPDFNADDVAMHPVHCCV